MQTCLDAKLEADPSAPNLKKARSDREKTTFFHADYLEKILRDYRDGQHKTHLATALGYAACQLGISVLFASAIEVVNTLQSAHTKGTPKAELRKYTAPSLLILDEVGHLPIDQRGADLLFQVIRARDERGSIVLTTNKAYKQWPSIFNGDSTITCAVLDGSSTTPKPSSSRAQAFE